MSAKYRTVRSACAHSLLAAVVGRVHSLHQLDTRSKNDSLAYGVYCPLPICDGAWQISIACWRIDLLGLPGTGMRHYSLFLMPYTVVHAARIKNYEVDTLFICSHLPPTRGPARKRGAYLMLRVVVLFWCYAITAEQTLGNVVVLTFDGKQHTGLDGGVLYEVLSILAMQHTRLLGLCRCHALCAGAVVLLVRVAVIVSFCYERMLVRPIYQSRFQCLLSPAKSSLVFPPTLLRSYTPDGGHAQVGGRRKLQKHKTWGGHF